MKILIKTMFAIGLFFPVLLSAQEIENDKIKSVSVGGLSPQETEIERIDIIEKPYTTFDLRNSTHSMGVLLSFGESFNHKFKNIKGLTQPHLYTDFVPELSLKYSCAIRHGWGITVEVPFSVFSRGIGHSWFGSQHVSEDTVWSNGVIGWGNGNYVDMLSFY